MGRAFSLSLRVAGNLSGFDYNAGRGLLKSTIFRQGSGLSKTAGDLELRKVSPASRARCHF
jgi:hypothetical protein